MTPAQVEEAALKKEKDPVSKARLEEVRAELAGLQEQLQPLLARYRAEKHRLEDIRALRKKREDYLVSLPPSQMPAYPIVSGAGASELNSRLPAVLQLSLTSQSGHPCCRCLTAEPTSRSRSRT